MTPKHNTGTWKTDPDAKDEKIPDTTSGKAMYAICKLLQLGAYGVAAALIALIFYGLFILIRDDMTARRKNETDQIANVAKQTKILEGIQQTQAASERTQGLLAKAVADKNETIERDHQLLIASQARDDVALQALKENGMIQQAVLSTLEQANKSMAPVPELRQRALMLQEQQFTLQQTQGKLLETLVLRMEKIAEKP